MVENNVIDIYSKQKFRIDPFSVCVIDIFRYIFLNTIFIAGVNIFVLTLEVVRWQEKKGVYVAVSATIATVSTAAIAAAPTL